MMGGTVAGEPQTIMHSQLPPEQIRARVEALEPWFHQIDLGHGIKTKSRPVGTEPVDHPWGTWQIVRRCLPQDLAGKSVLDVGCNAGFYTVQAKQMNAGHVLGVDSQRLHIRQARFVSRVLGLDIEYRRMSVYDLSPAGTGKFDITLALGLIYHCKHPLLALQKLFQVTREQLILESAVLAPAHPFESFQEELGGLDCRFHALAYVENDPACKEAVYNWFVPSVDCLAAMMKDVGFTGVVVISSEGERVLLRGLRSEREADSLNMPHLAAAELRLLDGPASCHRGSMIRFCVGAANTGQNIWLESSREVGGRGAVRLGVHLHDEWGEELVHDYGGVSLPLRVPPGSDVELEFEVRAPSQPGRYLLEFDMVSEQLTWFEDAGQTIPLVHRIEIV
jgi:tRNA (mo5U34)-methyltransferase